MMHKKSLKKTEGLLLAGVFWDPADTHIFPGIAQRTRVQLLKRFGILCAAGSSSG